MNLLRSWCEMISMERTKVTDISKLAEWEKKTDADRVWGCSQEVVRNGEKKVWTPDFNNERSEAQQSERSSPWKWVIERLARATASSGRLTFAYKDKWVTVLGVSHFPNFQKSLSGLWRHCGTGGESTIGQGRAFAFTGPWVSRLVSSEWRGCVAEAPRRTWHRGKQFAGTKRRGQFSRSVKEKSMANPGGIGEVGRSFYTDFTDVFTKGKFSIWDNPPD